MPSRTKLIVAIAVPWLLLAGQIVSEAGDPYMAVKDGRPIATPGEQVITLRGWGAIESYSEGVAADCADQGVADFRLSASAGQIATSVATLGFLRPLTVTYRCHAGNSPVGEG